MNDIKTMFEALQRVNRDKDRMIENLRADKGVERVVRVHELIYCPLKFKFAEEYPQLAERLDPRLLLGALVHIGVGRIFREEIDVGHAKFEVLLWAKVEDSTIVAGFADIVDHLRARIIEIKYASSDLSLPHPHHVLQVQAYLALAAAMGLDYRGELWYFTPQRVAIFEVPPHKGDPIAALKALLHDDRAPRYDWECQYCPYAILCPHKVVNNKGRR